MISHCEEHGYFKGEDCPCCHEPGSAVLTDEQEDRLGRFVSGALRHFPDKLGLSMYPDGWVSFNALASSCARKYRWMKKEYMYALLDVDDKERYEISGGKIRARYGHSVDVVLNYPEYEGEFIYYGISPEEEDIILESGVIPVRQKYVHLSTDPEKAYEVASVHTERPIILKIDADRMIRDHFKVMRANDHIVLTKSIPPEYISEILEVEDADSE